MKEKLFEEEIIVSQCQVRRIILNRNQEELQKRLRDGKSKEKQRLAK